MEGDFHVEGAEEIANQAKRAKRELDLGQNLVLRDVADLWRKGEQEVFQSRGGSLGRPWAPLKASTMRSRARLNTRFGLGIGPSEPRLVLFGDMRAALTEKGGAQEQEVGLGKLRIAIDTRRINRHDRSRGMGMTLTASGHRRKPRGKGGRYPDDILKIHQDGTSRVPARPVIGTPEATERAMEERVGRYFDHAFELLIGGA